MGKRNSKPYFMTEAEWLQHEDDYSEYLDWLETNRILKEWNRLEGR